MLKGEGGVLLIGTDTKNVIVFVDAYAHTLAVKPDPKLEAFEPIKGLRFNQVTRKLEGVALDSFYTAVPGASPRQRDVMAVVVEAVLSYL